MASIKANIKDGKTVSFRFRCCVDRAENGKQVFRTLTWHIPDGLIPSKAERAAKAAANEWEKQVKFEYEQDLKDPERAKKREIDRTRRTLRTSFKMCGFRSAFATANTNTPPLNFTATLPTK